MSKESMYAFECKGCGQSFAHMEYHIPKCANPRGANFEDLVRKLSSKDKK